MRDESENRSEINVGLFAAHSPDVAPETLAVFGMRAAADAMAVLEDASDTVWKLHREDATRLSNDEPQLAADFLDEASLRLVEGPYDVIVVVTDVGLMSRRHRVEAGLASPIARVIVVSTRRLRLSPRGEPLRELDDEPVRRNAAALLLHLFGHILGLEHAADEDDPMAPFVFDPSRRELPRFRPETRGRIDDFARRLPERELEGGGWWRALVFHLASALRHPGMILRTVARNRAPLLPLSLPGLVTAAVAPTLILVFGAEIWDVGLNMGDPVAWSFAAASILAATAFLPAVQNLLFPRKDRRVVTEHMAVVNVTVFLTMLLAMIGLFAMLGALMLVIELWVFPEDLIATWPTLEDPNVGLRDKLRLAGFMSSLGVLTGALAGGLESRNLIRHLAFFKTDP